MRQKKYFIKDYKSKRNNNVAKKIKELKGTKECSIRSFAFYYNNICQVYKNIKYSASYWL